MIGNKTADKITSVSKKSSKKLENNETEVDVERATPKKRKTTNYWLIKVSITI